MHAFSPERNIIILTLDSFQSDLFQELLDERDNYRDIFSGFTCYRNALTGYAQTAPSMLLLLTGKYYDNSLPFDDFRKDAFRDYSIMKYLKEHDYRIEFFCKKRLVPVDKNISNLIENRPYKLATIDHLKELLTGSVYRCVPQRIKRYLYNTKLFSQYIIKTMGVPGKLAIRRYYRAKLRKTKAGRRNFSKIAGKRRAFLDEKDGYVLRKDKRPVFKYIHLIGVHLPCVFNEKNEFEMMPRNRSSYKRQAIGLLRSVSSFIAELKRLGIYDNSMIFIIGDHGSMHRPMLSSLAGLKDVTNAQMIKRGKALPLILVKPFYAEGELRVSDAPVSLGDIPETIASATGIDHDFDGSSMFSLGNDEMRERRFFKEIKQDPKALKAGYHSPYQEYIVTGFSWFRGSWKKGAEYKAPIAE